jgi:endonuclease G
LLLGNPSLAGEAPDNYLLERPQHALSYNRSNGGPNWVAWHLEKSDLGGVKRGDFLPDPLLPPDWQIRPSDYRGSGYDRGHVCPSGDRTRTRADNSATFVMSNMLPQAAALNQQVWKDLEDYSRSLVRSSELYIVAGGQGSAERIAKGRVNVPSVCWKIIVVLPRGENDLQRIDANTRIIAVSMPNRERAEIADSRWPQWITTVDQIEKTTGYDFFSTLPNNIEQILEQKLDPGIAKKASRKAATSSNRSTSGSGDSRAAAPTVPPPTASPNYTPPTSQLGSAAPAYQPPVVEQQAPSASDSGQASVQVWVNTNSGIYHYPGTRWYGTTKNGEFMSESQALAQGHRAARNGQ